MKAALLAALLLWQVGAANQPPAARPEYLRYERAVSVPAATGQACAVLPAGIFPHAEPSLADLRLFPAQPGKDAHEIPYVITISQSATDVTEPARVLNLGSGLGSHAGGHVVFDLAMPSRPYSDVMLDLAAHDFLATATVSGEPSPSVPAAQRTALGSFTLFDLSAQHLSRDTTLPLVESTFPYLHVELALAPSPGSHTGVRQLGSAIVQGAQVPPSRLAQTVYTTVASTVEIATRGRETVATVQVPARVPIEHVAFALAPGYHGSFSRDVHVTATPESREPAAARAAAERAGVPAPPYYARPPGETISGTILRVHQTEAGHEIRTEELGFPAILGANLQSPAKVEVVLENGDDQPLPITEVRLEMRQRELCFEAGAQTAALALFYGDPALEPPVYDYQRLFRAEPRPAGATLGTETPNPEFRPRPAAPESFTERNPEVLWIVLIIVICILATIALRSARNLTW